MKPCNNFHFFFAKFHLHNDPAFQGDELGHVQSRQEFKCGFPGFGRLHSVGCAGSSACGGLWMNHFDLTNFELSVIGPLLPDKCRGMPREYDRHPESILIGDQLPAGSFLPGDKAFEAEWIRKMIEEQDAVAIIPDRINAKADPASSQVLYRLRNRVGCFFDKLKQFWRIAARCEKLAANHIAMIKPATIRIRIRAGGNRRLGSIFVEGSGCAAIRNE